MHVLSVCVVGEWRERKPVDDVEHEEGDGERTTREAINRLGGYIPPVAESLGVYPVERLMTFCIIFRPLRFVHRHLHLLDTLYNMNFISPNMAAQYNIESKIEIQNIQLIQKKLNKVIRKNPS